MVLANDSIKNGKRSRGPSPNGHGSPESSSEDENVVPFAAEKIRVGRDYQAVCPELEPSELRKPELLADRALLVWSPTIDISDNKLDEYITVAKEKYGYNGEQALGMLFWHKHDLDRAASDLANFTPFPDEWTVEDKVLFEQAFQFHGKTFHRIRQMLPDKSIASLVKYYYSWKKTRARTSLMDRGAPGPGQGGKASSDGGGSEHGGSDKESDNEDKRWRLARGVWRGSSSPSATTITLRGATQHGHAKGDGGAEGSATKWCTVCGIQCSHTTQHNSHKLCQACLVHARRTGNMRPLCGPASGRRPGASKKQRFKHKLPRGIYINHDDLVAMATGPQPGELAHPALVNEGETMLKAMDREIITLKRQVQQNKQQLSTLKRKCVEVASSASIDELRPGEPAPKLNSRWTNEELLMAVTGVKKYGKDFAAIAETIGTKNENHVRTFFASYRRRYNLDAVLREHEAERGAALEAANAPGASTDPAAHPGGTSNEESGEPGSASVTNGPRNSSPVVIKDDKMEVDSEGCPLGAPAEQGGNPTTPSKPKLQGK